MADAGQTGATETMVPPTEKGEPKKGDAGQPEAGTGEPGIDPQKLYDKARDEAFAEARRTFAPKIKELEDKLAAVEARAGNKAKDKAESDDLQRQIDEVKRHHQEQLTALQSKIEAANAATARAELMKALQEAGIKRPEIGAKLLADRVKADVTAEEGGLEVLTDKGGRALNRETGEPMTVSDLAREFAQQYPELVADRQQPGSGFGRSGEPRPTSLRDQIADAERKGDFNTARRLKSELAARGL